MERLSGELVAAASVLGRRCGEKVLCHLPNRVGLFTLREADLDLQLLQCLCLYS